MNKQVHPFPARMAPGIALESLRSLRQGSVVLDPMSGSGTVLREATELGHSAIGYDVDPLAVLMAKVWTTPIKDADIGELYAELIEVAGGFEDPVILPWLVDDDETTQFIKYWFADAQAAQLSRLGLGLHKLRERADERYSAALSVLELNLSRIIVTKEQAASLARDTSHSRPHRVSSVSEYDVFGGYARSLKTVRRRLSEAPPQLAADVNRGDARKLTAVESRSVDAVVTSPPYLNAIDYLRGHRLSLVWLGWTLTELRNIRSNSIGSERSPDKAADLEKVEALVVAMVGDAQLAPRYRRMVQRYAHDVWDLVSEVTRVLKAGGQATFVVGNSCLKDTFIRNADGVSLAAKLFGLQAVATVERELPARSRYLPVTGAALGKRMRTESVLSFALT